MVLNGTKQPWSIGGIWGQKVVQLTNNLTELRVDFGAYIRRQNHLGIE